MAAPLDFATRFQSLDDVDHYEINELIDIVSRIKTTLAQFELESARNKNRKLRRQSETETNLQNLTDELVKKSLEWARRPKPLINSASFPYVNCVPEDCIEEYQVLYDHVLKLKDTPSDSYDDKMAERLLILGTNFATKMRKHPKEEPEIWFPGDVHGEDGKYQAFLLSVN